MNSIKSLVTFVPALLGVASLVSCSSSPKEEAVQVQTAPAVEAPLIMDESCPNPSDLRGFGIAENPAAAEQLAQKNIAAQIQSTVVAASNAKISETTDADGNEMVQSSFQVESKVITRLENAQDVKIIASRQQGGKSGVVACMSRSDAMKPYVNRARILQDSLHFVAKTFEGAVHPLIMNKTYKTGQRIYNQYVVTSSILNSLGMVVEASTADSDYKSMHDAFTGFLSNYAMYFEPPQSELENAIYTVVSQNFSVVSGECRGGLLLTAGSQNEKCSEGSLGIKCSATLILNGSSCEGESYFNLMADVSGSGKYSEDEAKEKLKKNIQKAEWFTEWRRELNRWRLK